MSDFLDDLFSELFPVTERAAVLVMAAMIDRLLAQALSAFFLPHISKADELLEGDSPLSTFSARIMAAHRLGLVDAEVTRCLHIFRRIRNDFAHEVTGCSLTTAPHRDRIRE